MKFSHWGKHLALILSLASPLLTHAADTDGDGVDDSTDSCILYYNPNQVDTNGDGTGDVCDTNGVEYTISTIAGTGGVGSSGDDGQATLATLNSPYGVTVDTTGNLYIADLLNHRIRKIATDGTISTVVGTGSAGLSGDGGLAVQATINTPYDVTVDSAGTLYIPDNGNHSIRKVTSSGVITTVVGTGVASFSGDAGSASLAALNSPFDVAVDSAGNLYIADQNNQRIRKVLASNGTINTLAGTGTAAFSGDNGNASLATLFNPSSVTIDSAGNIYLADRNNQRIRKINTSGFISTVAGTGTSGFSGDGASATSAQLNTPTGVTLDSSGNLYITDSGNHRIRKVNTSGIISTIAGSGSGGFSGDGSDAAIAALNTPNDVTVDSAGNIYIADTSNQRIRKLTPLLSDTDGDFIAQSIDNCPAVANTNQDDTDGDGQGDACDTDDDNDGLSDTEEAAAGSNPKKADTDSDGINDNVDLCKILFDPNQSDSDNDGIGDSCDTDGVEYTISTISGNGSIGFGGDNSGAIQATLNTPYDVAIDSNGNIYIADYNNYRIRKVAPDGIITTVAGTGSSGFIGNDGNATQATLNQPHGVAADTAGNIYIADSMNHRIRKVAPNGIISTIAGTGSVSFSGDAGSATSAALNTPTGVAVDSSNNIYIADSGNHRIRKITTNGIISTIAGTGVASFSGDSASATTATLNTPTSIAVDSNNNIYIADSNNHRIRKITTDGNISTVAGTGVASFSGDGSIATAATLNVPTGVTLDSIGNLFISDRENHRIRKIDSSGIISTVAGTGVASFSGDGSDATAATLNTPYGIAVDTSNNIYIADSINQRIRKLTLLLSDVDGDFLKQSEDNCPTVASADQVDTDNDGQGDVCDTDDDNDGLSDIDEATAGSNPLLADTDGDGINDGADLCKIFYDPTQNDNDNDNIGDACDTDGIEYTINTLAGNGLSGFSGDDAAATLAKLNNPSGIAIDSSGNIYISDRTNHRVRKVTVDGIISTVAGTGSGSFSGDGGQATQATLRFPRGIAVDASDNLYIADRGNHRIRKVTVAGIISTVAGTGLGSFSGDGGEATQATLNNPYGIAVDASGNLYVADQSNHRIRKVTVAGIISTVAGTGSASFSGDGGNATQAALNNPYGITVDAAGNLYIVDQSNHRIRKVTAEGIISTVAGTGSASFSGDGGNATQAALDNPSGIAVDAAGNLYIADSSNHRIRKIAIDGVITTVAGTGVASFSGDDGDAKLARLNFPKWIAVDSNGNLYIADQSNHRIRKISLLLSDDDNDFIALFKDNCPGLATLDVTNTDGDSQGDACDTDDDDDGLSDTEEATAGTNDKLVDTDGDGLSDFEELNEHNTNPNKMDSDGNGLNDTIEVNGQINVAPFWRINNQNISFTSQTNIALPEAVQKLLTGDFDLNGLTDVVYSNSNDQVLIQYQSVVNTFETPVVINDFSASHMIIADIDGDGDSDIYAVRNSLLNVLINNGQNGFARTEYTTSLATILRLRAMELDTNREGLELRIFSNNNYSDVLYDASAKTFTHTTISYPTTDLVAVDFVDLSNDGAEDQLLLTAGTINWAQNLNNGTYSLSNLICNCSVATHLPAYGIALTNSGRKDVVYATNNQVHVIYNNGNGQFSGTNSIAETGGILLVDYTFADFDLDGDNDLILATANSILVFDNNQTSGTFDLITLNTTVSGLTDITLADLNSDGTLDVLASSITDTKLAEFINTTVGLVTSLVAFDHGEFIVQVALSATPSDDNNDTLQFTLSGIDAGLFDYSLSSGLTFKTAPFRATPSDSGANNVYELSITASDGAATASINLQITIQAADSDADSDNDGLSNAEEAAINTNPSIADTDGDGINDGDEVNTHNTSPTLIDSDRDGVNDGDELKVGTAPTTPNTDFIISFEDGLLPKSALAIANTNLGTDKGWIADKTSDATHGHGDYSLRAETIVNRQSAGFAFTYPFDGSNLMFAAKVSSEQGADKLTIRVDGVIKTELSGERDWNTFSIAIPAGEHTVSFIYSKNSFNSVGDDTAWIDNIRFKTTDDVVQDSDKDGLSDLDEEEIYSTNPNLIDSDFDGVNDGDEVALNTNPNLIEAHKIVGFEDGLAPAGMLIDDSATTGWIADNSTASQGSFSYKGNAITIGQSAQTGFWANFSGGQLNFDAKLSTQASVAGSNDPDAIEGLAIYVDGDLEWIKNGELDWFSDQIVISTGLHHVNFVYFKNSDIQSDDETVWIDNIQFDIAQFGLNADMDEDGLIDSKEVENNAIIWVADTDADGLLDGEEVNIYSTEPDNADTDEDGLTDGEEVNTHFTKPDNADTDSDGFSDFTEVSSGSNPLDPDSFPKGAVHSIKKGGSTSGGSICLVSLFIFSMLILFRRRERLTKQT